MKPQAKLLTARRVIGGLFLFAVLACAIWGCRPRPVDPPIIPCADIQEAISRSQKHAGDVGGKMFVVAPTGSMKPLLNANDCIVTTRRPFSEIQLGSPVTYQAQWRPLDYPPVTHRANAKDADGLIMEGDSVPHGNREAKYRVTDQNYIGVVIAIYRAKVTP